MMKRKIRITLLITALILGGLLGFYEYQMRDVSKPVTVTVTEQKCVYNSVSVSGNTVSDKATQLYVSEPACVTEVYAKEGDTVKAGEPLWLVESSQQSGLASSRLVSELMEAQENDEIFVTDLSCGKVLVYAKQGGTLLKAPVVGKSLMPGLPYARIVDLNSMQVAVKIPESFVRQVCKGQNANVTVDAVSDEPFAAVVEEVSPCAIQTFSLTGEESKVTIQAVLSLLSKSDKIRPGYSVTAKIFTDKKENAIVLPYDAVMQEGEEEFVLAVNQKNRIVRLPVKTGYLLSDVIEIREGLSEGIVVVRNASKELQPGDLVKVIV